MAEVWLSATAEGYSPGEAECTVAPRGYAECLIPVYEPDAGPGDPPDPGGTSTWRGGCQAAGGGAGTLPGLLLGLIGLGLVSCRRRGGGPA